MSLDLIFLWRSVRPRQHIIHFFFFQIKPRFFSYNFPYFSIYFNFFSSLLLLRNLLWTQFSERHENTHEKKWPDLTIFSQSLSLPLSDYIYRDRTKSLAVVKWLKHIVLYSNGQHILLGRRIQPHWLVDTIFSSYKSDMENDEACVRYVFEVRTP